MDTNENVKKKGFPKVLMFFVIFIVLVLIVGFAYARYITIKNGEANAQVAKWRFELKDGIVETADQIDFPITRTDDKSDVVQPGTIGPGTYGEIPITVVTTGTETHMKYDLNITIDNCPTNLKFYKDANHKKELKTTRSGTGNNNDPKIATITIVRYIDKTKHGEHEHIIYWDWPFETGKGSAVDENDLIDTADMNKTMTMAIAATGMQVTEVQPNEDDPITTLYAKLLTDGTLVLSSSEYTTENGISVARDYGNIYTFQDNNAETNPAWYNERGQITNVLIEDRIQPKSLFRWFDNCINLRKIDNIYNLDTSNATNMKYMFNHCEYLSSVDVSNFDTSSVTNMQAMFQRCDRLTALDVSNFDTSSVTTMAYMFNRCYELTTLNVSNFNTDSVTNMSYMFSECYKLTTLYASEKFTTGNLQTSSYMFYFCNNIKGGNGTTYNSKKTDKEYARIDTAETPGYFTEKIY